MYIHVDTKGTVSGFTTLLNRLESRKDVTAVLVLSCDDNGFTPEQLSPSLQGCSKPIFGGIFPAILHDHQKLETGTVMVGMTCPVDCLVQEELGNDQKKILPAMLNWSKRQDSSSTLLAFCDALSGGTDKLSEALLTVFGLRSNCIGGGAGSLTFRGKPCIITNKGLLQDCAVLAIVDMESGVCARHGWHPLEGPFTVTETEGSWLRELDGKPAFDVYREVVERHSAKRFGMESFFDMAKGYPFGVPTLHGEHLVRDPLAMQEDGSMLLAGVVKEGAQLDILTGNKRSLLYAAERATWHARETFNTTGQEGTILLMDCISRVLYLDQDFQEELDAINDGVTELVGACTIGEFAGNGRDYLEFYNKTAVAGIFRSNPVC